MRGLLALAFIAMIASKGQLGSELGSQLQSLNPQILIQKLHDALQSQNFGGRRSAHFSGHISGTKKSGNSTKQHSAKGNVFSGLHHITISHVKPSRSGGGHSLKKGTLKLL